MAVDKAISTGFYQSLLKVLERRAPRMLQLWDREEYRVYGPSSLEDEAVVKVVLINKNKKNFEVVLPL